MTPFPTLLVTLRNPLQFMAYPGSGPNPGLGQGRRPHRRLLSGLLVLPGAVRVVTAVMLALMLSGWVLPTLAEPGDDPLVIPAGAFAGRQVVAIGQDVEIAGEARSDVAALDGSVEVTGHVLGDIIVLGGNLKLGGASEIGGDIFVFGGEVEAVPGSSVAGRTVAYPSASAAWITLLEGPTLGLDPLSPVVLGSKLALMAAWAVVLLFFFAVGGRHMLATSDSVRQELPRCFVVGLVGALTILLTVLLLSALAGPVVSVPLVLLATMLAVLLKLWGIVAVFHALGAWLLQRIAPRFAGQPIHAATLGLAVLGLLKFVPWIAGLVWAAATLIGVGAALSSKFGRREPWFDLAALDSAPLPR